MQERPCLLEEGEPAKQVDIAHAYLIAIKQVARVNDLAEQVCKRRVQFMWILGSLAKINLRLAP
jgi:hypothetical protein